MPDRDVRLAGFDIAALEQEIGSATLTVDGVGYDVAYRVVHDWRLVGVARR